MPDPQDDPYASIAKPISSDPYASIAKPMSAQGGDSAPWYKKAWNAITEPIGSNPLDVAAGMQSHAPNLGGGGGQVQAYQQAQGNPTPRQQITGYANSAPTLQESQSPVLTGLKKGAAGAVRDTADVALSAYSPAALAVPGGSGASTAASEGVNAIPTTTKAGKLFADVAKDANKVPVTLDNAGEYALKLMDWQKKTQLGPTINKFLNRITNPKLGPLTYEESRDWYQLLGKLSFEETSKLAPKVKSDLMNMVMGFKRDIGTAAQTVGKGAEYYQAMQQYAKASKLADVLSDTGDYLGKQALDKLPWLAAYYGVKKGYDVLK